MNHKASWMDEVDWHSLSHAYGDASDVPRMLECLRAKDKAIRDEAWAGLFGSLRHQGDVYESSIFMVDVFCQLLDDTYFPAKDEILLGLAHWVEPFGVSAKNFRGPSLAAQLNRAVSKHCNQYILFLKDRSPAVRAAAAHVLSVCLSHPDQAGAAITAAINAERNGRTLAEMLLRLANLSRPQDPKLFEMHTNSGPPSIRAAAAWSWVAASRDGKPPKAAIHSLNQMSLATHRAFLLRFRHEPTLDDSLGRLSRHDEPEFVELMVRLLRIKNVEIQQWVVTFLGSCKSPTAMAGIQAALNADAPEVRRFAAFIVGDRGQRAAIPWLVERLQNDADIETRLTVLRAIAKLVVYAKPAMPAVHEASTNDVSEKVRQQAKEVEQEFERVHASDDLPTLIHWVDDSERPGLARLSLRRIAHMASQRPKHLIQTALEALSGASPANARKWALALQRVAPQLKNAKRLVSALRPHLQDRFLETRVAVGNAIRAMDPQGVDPQYVPSVAAIQVVVGAKPASLSRLVRKMLDDRRNDQHRAIWELTQLGDKAAPALPYLQEVMKRGRLRAAAAGAISWIKPSLVRRLIPELLEGFGMTSRHPESLRSAHDFIRFLGPPLHAEAIAFLRNVLPHGAVNGNSPVSSIVYAIHEFHRPDPAELLPLLGDLLRLDWPGDHRGFGSPVAQVLKFLKSHGAPYAGAADWVEPLLRDKALKPLAQETLQRITAN